MCSWYSFFLYMYVLCASAQDLRDAFNLKRIKKNNE